MQIKSNQKGLWLHAHVSLFRLKDFKSSDAFNWNSVTWHKSDEYVMHLSSALAQR